MYDVSKNFQPRNKKCPIKRISKSLRTVCNIINYRSGSTRVTNYHTTYKDRLSRIVYTRNRPSRNAPSQSHGISKKAKTKQRNGPLKNITVSPSTHYISPNGCFWKLSPVSDTPRDTMPSFTGQGELPNQEHQLLRWRR